MNSSVQRQAHTPVAATRQFLVFCLGETFFGLPVESVAEVVQPRQLTVLPKSPAFLRGLIQLREKVVPVMDLRERFGFPVGEGGRLVIVRVPSLIAYHVDKVEEVLRCDASALLPAPPVAAALVPEDFLEGVISISGNAFVLVLRPDTLLTQAEKLSLGGAASAAALMAAAAPQAGRS